MKPMQTNPADRGRPRLTHALLAGLIASGIAACDLDRLSDAEAIRLSDPVYRHPIAVEAHRARVDLASNGHHDGYAGAYLEATRFIRQYRRDGRGPLTVAYNRHNLRLVDGVRHIAAQNGVPHNALRMVERRDGGHGVSLSYDGVIAKGPTCGDWSEDTTRHPSLLPMPIFGCASRRNLAHMVAEPTDLLFPQVEAPRGSERRGETYRAYTGQKSGGTSGGASAAPTAPNAASPTQ